jgi:hypothetical protein
MYLPSTNCFSIVIYLPYCHITKEPLRIYEQRWLINFSLSNPTISKKKNERINDLEVNQFLRVVVPVCIGIVNLGW